MDDANVNILYPQSGTFCHETLNPTKDQKTTTFFDAAPTNVCEVESHMDSTRYATSDSDTELATFFERPVRIANISWATGGSIDTLIYPWDLWMKNARVANRLTNFRNFKGRLHLKFLLNGNPFFWGRTFVSYIPRRSTFPDYIRTDTTIGSLMPALQRPHIFLDPSSSDGGEMVLPFFWENDCVDLTVQDIGQSIGQLWIKSLVPLEHAQNLTNGINITVFAWAEGVDLTTPTQTVVAGLSPQAGDEYGNGPLSRPANLVAALASKMVKVPVIGPYAMATQIAASAVGSVAALFGFSRPRLIEPIRPLQVWQTGNLCCVDQTDTSTSLALTAKQELTIDPRTIGLAGADELDFSYLQNIKSYLGQAAWNLADVENKIVMSFPVTPCMAMVDTIVVPASKPYMACSTTAFIAQCFDYWRGSMTYRFQIVASGYHRGRLLIVWDPVKGQTVPELNTVYSKIVDIAEDKEFEITVGWGAASPGLITRKPLANTLIPLASTLVTDGTLFVPDPIRDNGVVTVYVLNELVTSGPNTGSVRVLLHSYSKDMNHWAPVNDGFIRTTYELVPFVAARSDGLTPQTGVVDGGTELVTSQDATELGTVGAPETPDVVATILAGEMITSFRTCMKRYTRYRTIPVNLSVPATNFAQVSWTTSPYFLPRGSPLAPTGMKEYAPMTIQAMVQRVFAADRGSWRINCVPRTYTELPVMQMARDYLSDTTVHNTVYYPITTPNAFIAGNAFDKSWNGVSIAAKPSGGTQSVELPGYENRRGYITTNATTRTRGCRTTFTLSNEKATAQSVINIWDEYISVGEDYNVFFFLGIPPMWVTDPGFV